MQIYLLVITAALILLTSLHVVYFPLEQEEGLTFSGTVDPEDSIGTSDIYQNLSGRGLELENTTDEVTLDDCSDGSCQVDTEVVRQLKVTSDNWSQLRVIKIWRYPNGTIGLEGSASLTFDHLLDFQAIDEDVDSCKEKVVEIMDMGQVPMDQEDITVIPMGFFGVSSLCLGMFVLIIFTVAVSMLLIVRGTKSGDERQKDSLLNKDVWSREDEYPPPEEEQKEEHDYTLDKIVAFLGVIGLSISLMYVLGAAGYSSLASSFIWIIPLALVVLAVFLFMPKKYGSANLAITALIILAAVLILLMTYRSSTFICCLALPLIIVFIIIIIFIVRDMKSGDSDVTF